MISNTIGKPISIHKHRIVCGLLHRDPQPFDSGLERFYCLLTKSDLCHSTLPTKGLQLLCRKVVIPASELLAGSAEHRPEYRNEKIEHSLGILVPGSSASAGWRSGMTKKDVIYRTGLSPLPHLSYLIYSTTLSASARCGLVQQIDNKTNIVYNYTLADTKSSYKIIYTSLCKKNPVHGRSCEQKC
jgi:hypothetical protein